MATNRPRVTSLPPLPRALRYVGRLEEERFELLRNELRRYETYNIEVDLFEEIAKIINEDDVSEIFFLITSLEYLYPQLRSWVDELNNDPKDILKQFLRSTGLWTSFGDEPENSFERFASLLEDKPKIDLEEKRSWLKRGIIDNAENFSTFVDIRPNFTKSRQEITELLIISILEISVQTFGGEQKSYSLQLDETSLSRLKAAVEDIEKKVDTVKKTDYLSGNIIKSEEQE